MKAIQASLINDVLSLEHDPLAFCRYVFPWGVGELQENRDVRHLQEEILCTVGNHLKNPATRYQPLKIAVASGHGIGKSAMIAMLCHWALATCVDTKIVVTANTKKQLTTKTWPEFHKWTQLSFLRNWFVVKAESVHSADRMRSKSWRADAVPWSEHNTEAFAGLH